jgi:hypothetical protein
VFMIRLSTPVPAGPRGWDAFSAVAVTPPLTEIFDLALGEREWRLAPALVVRPKPAGRKATRSTSSCSTSVVASEHWPQPRPDNVLNSGDVCCTTRGDKQ